MLTAHSCKCVATCGFLITATSRVAHFQLTPRMNLHKLLSLLTVVTSTVPHPPSLGPNKIREDIAKLGECKKLLSSFLPVVKPYTADHLKITWYDLLDKCRGLVETVSIFFDYSEASEDFIKGTSFKQTDPCKFHKGRHAVKKAP